MDRIPDLSAFQGVLLSADNQYSFAKLKFKGGNEDKIKYVVNKLFHFLKEKNYITEQGVVQGKREEYRKLALYLVLNADLPALEEMTELPGAEALVWTLPTLPGTLLSELFRGLHMRPYLYEMVAFCRPALALQLADAFLAELREPEHPARDPERAARDLEHPALLAAALHRLACRLQPARAPPGAAAAALAGLRACLARLAAPADDCHLLLARTLTVMLRLILTCFARFTSVQRFEDKDFADVYLATHDPDGLTAEALDLEIRDGPEGEISEGLRACDALLLDRCAALAMTVSVDAFCAWSEHDHDDGRDVQRAVGELCHGAVVALRGVPGAAGHRLVSVLEQIAIRPLDAEDVIDGTDPDEIAARVRGRDAGAAAWLAALLRRPELWRHPALLRALRSRAATFDGDQSARLFRGIVARQESDAGDGDGALRRTVAVEAFRRCGDPVKDRILAEQFRDRLHDELATAESEAAATETFNRLTAGAAAPGDALVAFLQSPRRALRSLARAAGDGPARAELALRVLERLGACRERRYAGDDAPALVRAVGAALDDAAAAGDDARHERLARFVAELAGRGLLPGAALLRLVVEPRLLGALRGGAGHTLCAGAALLRAVTRPPAPAPGPRAALLAALAQALDATLAPTADAAAARGPLLDLLHDTLDAYLEHIPERELQWLRGRLVRSARLTRAHYAALWPPPARAPAAVARLVQRHPVDILLLSTREWETLLPRGADEQTLGRARAALQRASRVARRRDSPEARACLHRGHAAAVRCIKNNYLSERPTEAQAESVASCALALAGSEPELAPAWGPLLAHLAAAPRLRSALVARLAAHHAPGARHLLARVQAVVG